MKDEQEMKTSPCPVSLGWPLAAGEKGQRGDKCPKGSVKVSEEKKREEKSRAEGKQSKAHRGEKLKQ